MALPVVSHPALTRPIVAGPGKTVDMTRNDPPDRRLECGDGGRVETLVHDPAHRGMPWRIAQCHDGVAE
jgi:hypothetical protein